MMSLFGLAIKLGKVIRFPPKLTLIGFMLIMAMDRPSIFSWTMKPLVSINGKTRVSLIFCEHYQEF